MELELSRQIFVKFSKM